MKELSIEEKAKRYDELLVKLQEAKVDDNVCDERYCCVIDEIVPELKESEDERIRIELLYTFQESEDSLYMVLTPHRRESFISWLEKQGKKDEEIILLKDKIESLESARIAMQEYHRLELEKLEKQSEQKPIACGHGTVDNSLEGIINAAIYWGKEAPTENGRIPEDKVKDAVDYYCSLIRNNNGWSEEDEKLVKNLISTLSNLYARNLIEKETKEKYTNLLKSIKDRYTWKPSDEQMDALRYVTNFDYGGHKAMLVSLYEQLKKLREE